MLYSLHFLLATAYALTPIFYAAVLFARWYQHKDKKARSALVGTLISAILLSGAFNLIFVIATDSRPRFDQIALGALFFMALLILIKGLLHLPKRITGLPPVGATTKQKALTPSLQLLLITTIAIPFLLSAIMTWRPKVAIVGTPMTELQWPFTPVTFPAADNTPISAWWIPAAAPSPNNTKTALICHGLGANKLNQLIMARHFHDAGYNVLTFDFRAHGASGGQFTSYGLKERLDVQGAVHYLRKNHPQQSTQITGIGASLGAAALIAAAGDNTDESQRINALIIYATYADLNQLAQSIADTRFPPGVSFLAKYLAFPLASVHANANLQSFRPIDYLRRFKGPVVIIQGQQDQIIPPQNAKDLINAANHPKLLIELQADHNTIIEDEKAATQAKTFTEQILPSGN